MRTKEIASTNFNQSDLNWFSEHSGDWNPIHVDEIAARRFMTGRVMVHGMFTLLWALDRYCESNGTAPLKFVAIFHRPITTGEAIQLLRIEDEKDSDNKLFIYCNGGVAVTILLDGACRRKNFGVPELLAPDRGSPSFHKFVDLKGLRGALSLQVDITQVSDRFPHLVEMLGILPVSAIMASSRVVGMFCPGLCSLYSGAEFELLPDIESTVLSWKVVRHTVAQAPIRIAVEGGGIAGRLDAFVRPEPVKQPSISQIASNLEPGQFRDQVAWVIGGGRGLGELVSKIVAAGNGRVVITYNKGLEDAQRVVDEINLWGGSCELFQLDVNDSESLMKMVQAADSPSHLYYFASPRISRSRSSIFDEPLLHEFIDVYVNSFSRMVVSLRRAISGHLKIFYPSTIFLEEMPKEFPEYIAAKSAGELLCKYYSKHLENLDILVRRLPRLATDQTNGIIKIATVDPLSVLIPVIKEMNLY